MVHGRNLAFNPQMRVALWIDQNIKVVLTTTFLLNLAVGIVAFSNTYSVNDLQIVAKSIRHRVPISVRVGQRSNPILIVEGEISRSFFSDARSKGVPNSLIIEIVDNLSSKIDFGRDLRRGDRYSLSYLPGSEVGRATLVSFSLTRGDLNFSMLRDVNSDGVDRYFDRDGSPLDNGFLRYPVKFSGISSRFSLSRYHPVLHYIRPHLGVDLKAAVGTAVNSIGDGKVVFAGRKGSAGLMVKIKHRSGIQSYYLHLSKISSTIKVGGAVLKGQKLGAVGMTGRATGPHLHFGITKDGRYVDPMRYQI